MRVTPEGISADGLVLGLKQTMPNLRTDVPQALVCVETTCQPPVSDPEKLKELLMGFSLPSAGGVSAS